MRLLLLSLTLLVTPAYTYAGDNACKDYAEIVRIIKQQYDAGTNRAKLLLAFQGPEPQNRAVRNIIHAVYRGQYDTVPADTMYQVMLDICNNERKDL